eukprot:TRINITY_DN8733_c0_g1_i1.p1 TRINITY_DN8733_c0_g1~~TRINITY_DN8733_c0_g1_i1.p1  ORF type:complete len:228 (+),score=98.34 TRINITY_DN8733_c0_g1_i1:77-685(+)
MAIGSTRCVHQFLIGLRVVAAAALLLCLAAHCVTIYKSQKDTWFVKCADCKNNRVSCPGDNEGDADTDCVKCCCDCTLKQQAFFYILRAYSLCFIFLSMLAEAELSWFSQRTATGRPPPLLALKYYWARGMLMIFIGFLTVESSVSPDDPTANGFADGAGWTLLGIGGLYVILSCIPGLTQRKDPHGGLQPGAQKLDAPSPT